MKNLATKQAHNLNLYVVVTICSLLIGIPTEVLSSTLDSHPEVSNTASSQQKSLDLNSTLISQSDNLQAEWEAYARSKYNYCDATLLSSFWGQSLQDTKALIGRKVLWGDGGIPYLEQYLVDARTQAIQQGSPGCSYVDGGYSYDDAVTLAEFWGDPTPQEAKQRIVRNLMLGNQGEIERALSASRR